MQNKFFNSVSKISVLLLITLLITSCGFTPKIRNSNLTSAKPVSEIKKLTIGGIEQWALIRGENITNPVLLFLHGGPGTS